eukprot:TRINITY_DN41258_c0_g1_i1.p2 TRINITY_DN41258_c0_g1~~TRINITY_DN41258_c0_g1_i1.p2  ORF type:complete len:100 (-),score=14.05 TRINITY_DN41258_c0_g1_i1:21-320(-)
MSLVIGAKKAPVREIATSFQRKALEANHRSQHALQKPLQQCHLKGVLSLTKEAAGSYVAAGHRYRVPEFVAPMVVGSSGARTSECFGFSLWNQPRDLDS